MNQIKAKSQHLDNDVAANGHSSTAADDSVKIGLEIHCQLTRLKTKSVLRVLF